jgi:hypothetical protein
LLVQQHDRDNTVVARQFLQRTFDQYVNATMIQQAPGHPSPRLPEECNECNKLKEEWDHSCIAVEPVCECCRKIFSKKMKALCAGFNTPSGYIRKDGLYCIDTIHVAMEQRSQMCDTPYSYEEPLRGITPKRYTDKCVAGSDAGEICGESMCAESGCNVQLEKVEGRFRVVEHYKKVYDEHPCEVAERHSIAEGRLGKAKARARQTLDNLQNAESAQTAQPSAADVTLDEKKEAERKEAEKLAAAQAALKLANADHAAAEQKAMEAEAAERQAAIKAAAANAALQYAKEQSMTAKAVVTQKAGARRAAHERVAVAQASFDQASTERAQAEAALASEAGNAAVSFASETGSTVTS